MPTFHHCVFCSPGSEPAWDQPNRAVRTRMLRGVGGAACEGRSYPDIPTSRPNNLPNSRKKLLASASIAISPRPLS